MGRASSHTSISIVFHISSLLFLVLAFTPAWAFANATAVATPLDLTRTGLGITCVLIFVIAYIVVIGEETLHMRKSKPVVVAAGIIWILVALAYLSHGDSHTAEIALRHNLLEYAELMLFLLAAMTYINTLSERNLFEALRGWLASSGFSLRTIFWLTGVLAFFISPVADNLTTALIMGAVVLAVGGAHRQFVVVGCINVVVAANAGGAFSPFGDITTLMVWQKGMVNFWEFFYLFLPSVINWLIPAVFMSFAVPILTPETSTQRVAVKPGGFVVTGLFGFTIVLAVTGHSLLHLPPVLGMMTGLGLLNLYGYVIKRNEHNMDAATGLPNLGLDLDDKILRQHFKPRHKPFDIFISLKRAEWDTLLFFYGVVLCVGGLSALGYLAVLSNSLYGNLGPTWANILIGVLSAIVDNIPIMFAVLNMNPDMSLGQWLLVTLTAGVGGSLLSIGSAAGVALMGQARGVYTFASHLKWTWAIALGYVASIYVHFLVNGKII